MNRSILRRLDKLDKPNSMMHKIIHYCATVDGKEKIFPTQEAAEDYELHHPGWFAEWKAVWPDGNTLVWNHPERYTAV